MNRLNVMWKRLPNWAKAGINTGWQSAAGTFLIALLGFAAKVQEWAGSTDVDFPSVTPLGKAVGSAFAGLVIGAGTALFRRVKPGPSYAPPPPPA